MNRLLTMLSRLTERRPVALLVGLGLLTALFFSLAGQQDSDNDMTAFSPDGDQQRAFDRVQEEFAANEVGVQVIVEGESSVVTPEALAAVAEVTGALTEADAVAAASTDGEVEVRSFAMPLVAYLAEQGIEPGSATPEQVREAFTAAATASPRALQMFSSDADPDSGTASAGLAVVVLDPEADQEAVADAALAVSEAVEGLDVDGVTLAPFSPAILDDEINTMMQEQMGRLLMLSMALIVVILAFTYRSVSDVAFAVVGLAATIGWMFGIGVLLGPDYLGLVGPFNQMTTVIPVLLVGLGVDYAIHLTSRYREEQATGAAPSRASATAVMAVGGALVLATVTTMVGFLTNLSSPLPPMRDFGVYTAVGVLAAFVVMTTFVPAARHVLDRRPRAVARAQRRQAATQRPKSRLLPRVMGRFAVLSERAPKLTLGLALAVTLVAAVGASQVSTTFSQDDFVPPDSEPGRLLASIDDLFGGDLTERTFVIIDGDVGQPEVAAALEEFPAALAGVPDVRTTPGTGGVAATVTPSPEGGAALVAVNTTGGQDTATGLAAAFEEASQSLRDAGVEVTVTSEGLVLEETLTAFRDSQVRGILITLLVSLLLLVSYFGIVDRSPVIGLVTMVPSMFVVTWVLGTMFLLGISFNVFTAMVSSLAIGIGVPYGIHVTHRFLEDRDRNGSIDAAIRQTITHTGGALVASAATTAAGFGVLTLSSLEPMRQFGLITALVITYSLIASVVVQPVCLALWAKWRNGRDGTAGAFDLTEPATGPADTASPTVEEPVGAGVGG